MATANLLNSISDKLPPGYEFLPTQQGDKVQVRSPLQYPDGGIVDVFVQQQPGGYLVTDYGDGLGWFRSQSIEGQLSQEQRRGVEEFCLSRGVKLSRGCLSMVCEREGLADTVCRVAHAVAQVSDLLAPAGAQPPPLRYQP